MMEDKRKYMLSVDQSTQGTKALLFDREGRLLMRRDMAHRQIINEKGWVEHDLEEIWENTKLAVKGVLEEAGIGWEELAGMGISNQRETIGAWDRISGKPVYHGIVWQCARGEEICAKVRKQGKAELVRERTGLALSPYFSAAKLAWIFENVPEAARLADKGQLCCGTIDAWLIYKLTGGRVFSTEYSNASRTQLFNLNTLRWDSQVCEIFGIPLACLPKVQDSDSLFGMTDIGGILDQPIPVCCAMGDSQSALYGQGCHSPGMAKATYGTGSSVMMNVGEKPVFCGGGLVSSIAWGSGGKVWYVLEGNVNYTGAVVTWLKDKLGLIADAKETERLAMEASPEDKTYIVPAFSGLGAPYWDSEATALITGITRLTGRAEMVRAALECIAYQIYDIVSRMGNPFFQAEGGVDAASRAEGGADAGFRANVGADIALQTGEGAGVVFQADEGANIAFRTDEGAGIALRTDEGAGIALRTGEGAGIVLQADGGPAKNCYLMQFQSDILGLPVAVPEHEELSGIGAAYMGGIRLGFYQKDKLFERQERMLYCPKMAEEERKRRIEGWERAVRQALEH